MAGEVQLHLKSNLIPSRDAQRTEKLVCTRAQEKEQLPPQESEPDLPLSSECLLRRHESQKLARGTGSLAAAHLGGM